MAKNRTTRIRDNLIANRERKPLKTPEDGFGIFRPASEEVLPVLGGFASEATDAIGEMLLRERPSSAEIVHRQDFGVTLAPYARIRLELARAFREGFSLGSFATTMADTDLMQTMDLKIKEIEWARMGEHKEARFLLFTFEEDDNMDLLREQLEFVRASLYRAGIYRSTYKPDKIHSTILRYGRLGDHMALSRKQANAAVSIAETIREKNMLDVFPVGPLVLGRGYRTNHPEAQEAFDTYVPEY